MFWNGQTQCFHGKHLNLTYCLNENYVNVAKHTMFKNTGHPYLVMRDYA